MRTLLIGVLAATLAGCNCLLPPQAIDCADANGLSCFDRMVGQSIQPTPASFKTDSPPAEIKSTIAAKTEKPSSARARGSTQLAIKTAKSTMTAAKVGPPASRIPLPPSSLKIQPQPADDASADSATTGANVAGSHLRAGAVANSNTRTIQEQVATATAVAERMTVAHVLPAPEPKVNNKDRPNHSEAGLRGDAENSAPPNNGDLLVALLMARPETRSVSDLTGKIIAIDDRYSASSGNVRTAIAAAGAAEVQLSEDQTKAIDRLISGEAPAAVLTLVSAEAAELFPEIAGFKIFRIPLSPRSLKARRDTP
jgi:hypothetical protein